MRLAAERAAKEKAEAEAAHVKAARLAADRAEKEKARAAKEKAQAEKAEALRLATKEAAEKERQLAECNYIRYYTGDGTPRWQARKGTNGWWYDFECGMIEARCAGANQHKMSEAMAGAAYVFLSPTGGFVVTSNKRLKDDFGLSIATGGGGPLRMCAAHCAFNITRNVRPELKGERGASQAAFEQIPRLQGTMDAADDPSVEDIQHVLLVTFNVNAMQKLYEVCGSPYKLINLRKGVLLVRLELLYEGQTTPAFHNTVFHAESGAILDPMASDRESTVVEDADRVPNPQGRKEKADANEKAMRAFRKSFPAPRKIKMLEVYLCVRA